MPVVRIPTVLRTYTGGAAKVEVQGTNIREVLADLVGKHDGLGERLLEAGAVRGYVNVFVDDEDIRYLGGLDTPVPAAAEVSIMPAVAGGAH